MIIGAAMLIDNSELAAQSRTHNSALIEDGDGSHRVPGAGRRCSWQVRVAGGQRVVFRLTVFRPAGRLAPDDGINVDQNHNHQQMQQQTLPHSVQAGGSGVEAVAGSCPWTLVIDDGETTPIREALCWRTTANHGGSHAGHHRAGLNGQVECRPKEGLACSVHLEWPEEHVGFNANEMPIFALNYEGHLAHSCCNPELY
jgi:hypothetical protein